MNERWLNYYGGKGMSNDQVFDAFYNQPLDYYDEDNSWWQKENQDDQWIAEHEDESIRPV